MNDLDKTKEQLIEDLAELRQRETQWCSVIANTPIFVALVDRAGTIQYINRTVPGLSLHDTIGRSAYDFVEAEYGEIARSCVERVFDTGQTAFYESVALGPNDSSSWYESYVGAVKAGDQVVAVTLVSIDITQRKQAEGALRLSEGNYRAIFDAANDAIFVHDPETGAILDANPKATEMYGYTTDELRQGRVEILSEGNPPYSQAEAMQWIGRAFSGPPQLFTWKSKEKAGRIFWTEVNLKRAVFNGATRLLAIVRDITERKLAEDALRVSEAKYRRLHQSMMDAFVSVDMDGHIQEYNDAYRKMLGYEPEELLALRYTDITPETWHPFETEIIQGQIVPRGYSDTYEKEYRKKDGTVFPVELRTFLIRDEGGAPCAMWAIVRDITERKQAAVELQKAHDELEEQVRKRTAELVEANEALRHLTERLSLATTAANVGIWDFDVPNNKLIWDDSMFRLYGITPESFAGAYEAWRACLHPADLCRAEAELQAALREGQNYDTEFRVIWPDKSVHWLQARAMVQHNLSGKAVRVLGANWDITERKLAEEALRQSHDELRAIHDGMADGLLIADVETKQFVRANAAICRMLGYSHDEMLSKSVMDIHPSDKLPELLKTFGSLGERQTAIAENIPVLRKDGTVFYADVAANRIVHEGRTYQTGFFRDITERRKAEETLRREHRTLKHLLQSSDHERQTIAYDIHDGLAQQLAGAIMQFQTFDHLKDKQPKLAAKAYDAGLTMLQQGHFEARRLIAGVRPPILDESGVVAAVAHLVHEQHREKGPKIDYRSRVDFDRLVPTLENAIYRIAQEGLANACQHSKSEKVRVSLLQSGDRVRIEVRDWGAGFDVKAVRGNRFGLEGIRQRARLLGGKCSIRSKVGKGSCITVELPIMERDDEVG